MKILFTKYFRFIIILSFIGVFQMTTAQSAWTKPKGELYSQFSFSTIPSYDEIYNDNTYFTSRTITDNTFQLYAEYGLTDKFTLIANIPVKSISTGNSVNNATVPLSIAAASETALGNLQIGLKHQLYNKKFVLSGQLTVEVNTSTFYNESGIRTGYDAWTFTPTLNVGRGYKSYFFQAFTGVDIRTNNYSSNFKIGGEFGYTAFKNMTLIAYLDLVSSLNDGTIALPQSNFETALYINNQEYNAIGLKGLYKFNKSFGITLGVGGALSANNVPKQLALSGGVFYKID